jgi:sugar phosphate isomerase/epimerase
LPDLTPEDAVWEIKSAGYEGVEWQVARVSEEVKGEEPSFGGNNLCTLEPTMEEARSLCEEADLDTPDLGTYISVGDAATREAMRFAEVAGAPQIRVGVGRPDGSSYAELFARGREFLAQVEELASEHGVKALVEIHHGTICPSASLAHRLVSGCDPELVGVIFDPGNMAQEGFEDYRIGAEFLGPTFGTRPPEECRLRAAEGARHLEAPVGAARGRRGRFRAAVRGPGCFRLERVARYRGL